MIMRISLGFKYLIFFFCATSVELYPFTIYFQYYVSASEKVLFEQSGLHNNYFYYGPNKRLIIRIQVNVIMPALNENWVLQFFVMQNISVSDHSHYFVLPFVRPL